MGCFVLLGLCAESDCIQLQTKITSGPWKGEKEGGKIYVCRITDAGRCKCCVVSSCIMCESISDLKKQQTQCNLFLWFFHLLPDLLVMNVWLCHLLPSRCPLWELWVIFLSWKSTQEYLQTFMKKTFVGLLLRMLCCCCINAMFVEDFMGRVSVKILFSSLLKHQ